MDNKYFYLDTELKEIGLSLKKTIEELKSGKRIKGISTKTGEEFLIIAINNEIDFFVDILYPQRSGNPNLPLRKHYQSGVLVSDLYGKIIDEKIIPHKEGDKPAIIIYEKKDGRFYKYQEKFYKDGIPPSEGDKPKSLIYHENGNILGENKNGVIKVYTLNGFYIGTYIKNKFVFSLSPFYSFLFELGFSEFEVR